MKHLLLLALLIGCNDRTVRIENPHGLSVWVDTRGADNDIAEVRVSIGASVVPLLLIPIPVPYAYCPSILAEKPEGSPDGR